MANIDDVINRARQPGGFSEQQQFTVARERAIRKMREFALADPHYYILELIQAAVANGATHVHIDCSSSALQFTYIGGGYSREELAQLFDFLFASKESLEHADIRQVALGVNALMMMEPSRIIIESGNGTLESTDRIVIRGDNDTVEVGTPDEALRGTFIRAEGLDRSAIAGRSNLDARDYGPPECTAIEQRCLAAPVPIIVNNEPVFGYSSQRTPVIFGYEDVVTFDEGDLYGTIGRPRHRHKHSFKLLTWGCWIESTEAALMEETKIGGVIAYDRLNKTADHSGIVRDEQFEKLWARIRPYARQVAEGRSGEGDFHVGFLGGEQIPTRNLRDLFREHPRAVVVTDSSLSSADDRKQASRIGEALDAPVLQTADDALESVDVLAGNDAEILEPNLDTRDDLAFYYEEPTEAPERPWLTGKLDLEPLDVSTLGETLVAEESVSAEARDRLVDYLGTRRPIQGTVYTPVETEAARELHVRLITLDRVVWEGPVQSPFPGHVLDVDLPPVAPSHLQETVDGGDVTWTKLLAEVVAGRAVDTLQKATRRSLESLAMSDQRDSDTGRRIALAALGRSTLKRLRHKHSDDDRPDVHFSLLRSHPGPDLLDIEVFETLDGTPISLRDLEDLMEQTAGVVYGVVPEVEPDLEGLDQSRILQLDLERERQLLSIVGEAAYVRIDQRDILAEVPAGSLSGSDNGGDVSNDDGRVFRVRDVAYGLHSYPKFPLLVEGADPSEFEETRREKLVESLVGQLLDTSHDTDLDASIRREAIRHLQWFVCRRSLTDEEAPLYGVDRLPLFLDGAGNPVTFRQVRRGLDSEHGLEMVDGRSSDVTELGALTDPDAGTDEERTVRDLTMNTWVLRLLAPHGSVRGAYDFDFSDAEAADVEATPKSAFLEQTTLDTDDLEGRIGVPSEPQDEPAVAIVTDDRAHAFRMRQPALSYGVTGFIRVKRGDVRERWKSIRQRVGQSANDILNTLVEEVPDLEPGTPEFERSVQVLFGFAAQKLQMHRQPDGTVKPHIQHPLAQKILELPLFPTRTGNPVSALRLVREFCVTESAGGPTHRVQLADDLPAPLPDWLDRHLTPANVVEPADSTPDPPDEETRQDDLSTRLETWLARLRPDDLPEHLASQYDGVDRNTMQTAVRVPNDGSESTTRFDFEFGEHQPCQYVHDTPRVLWLNPDHPLVDRAPDGDDSRAFAWLLVACYAHINDLLEPVTNEHELEFQRRVADSLDEM